MRRRSLVEALRVRNPCRVGYANLAPETERSRHCERCDQSVVDVSKLSRREVEALLEARERGARLCVHLLVREDDGAILLADGHALPPGRPVGRPGRSLALAAGTAALVACTKPEPGPSVIVPVAASPEPTAAAPPPSPSLDEPPSASPLAASPPSETPAASPPSEPPAPVAPAPPPPLPRVAPAPKRAPAPHGKAKAPVKYLELDGDPWLTAGNSARRSPGPAQGARASTRANLDATSLTAAGSRTGLEHACFVHT